MRTVVITPVLWHSLGNLVPANEVAGNIRVCHADQRFSFWYAAHGTPRLGRCLEFNHSAIHSFARPRGCWRMGRPCAHLCGVIFAFDS